MSAPKGVARTRPNAWLCVTGPDAATFLQGQCTQDLRPLQPGRTCSALWLTTKGKILGETLVLKAEGDRWWLWSLHTESAALQQRLEDFIIADDVTVTVENDGWEQLTFAGAASEAWLARTLGTPPPAAGAWVALGDGLLFNARRGQPQTWEWLRPKTSADAARIEPPESLGELSPAALHLARIAAGVPAIPGEFGPQDLPQEAGLEAYAVSFSKGCYLGQEVMARLHAMGRVRRQLVRVGGAGPAPLVNSELRQKEKRLGELRAVVDDGRGGWLGLALLQLLGFAPDATIVTAEGQIVHVFDPLQP